MSVFEFARRAARAAGTAGGAAVLLALPATLPAQQSTAALTGNPARGEPLYADTYNCYACHGFDAQTGERRLLPMNYTQEGFITFVQNSPLPQMPPYPDVSAQDLADIYAYIRTILVDAPEVDDLPLLEDILTRKQAALAD
jgi:mono/diheme cytochrome c family protein